MPGIIAQREMSGINLWIGPFGETKISPQAMEVFGAADEVRLYDSVKHIRGEYPNLEKLGKHIEYLQEIMWLKGEALREI